MEQYFQASVCAAGKQQFTEVIQGFSGAAEAQPASSEAIVFEKRSSRLEFCEIA
jgi:hypothetical protein